MAIAAGLVVAWACALRAGAASTRGFNPDEFEHLHGAWGIAHGLWPYRDYFEHHTPWLWLAIAPFFALVDVDHDPDGAVAFVLAARGAMWILGSVALALTFRLGQLCAGTPAGWLAAAVLSVTLAFVGKTVEIRPDVPALVCLLGSWVATVSALRRAPNGPGTRGAWVPPASCWGRRSSSRRRRSSRFPPRRSCSCGGWWTDASRDRGAHARRDSSSLPRA